MTLSKADKKRAADIRSEVAAVKKLQKIPPILPHLATALQKPASTWGARPAEKQQLQSKLMALPAELRNQIYVYTVASAPTVVISTKDSWDTQNYLNVMLVCRKVCREIQPIFFEENTLCFTDEALVPNYIRQLRQAMSVSGQAISLVSIERRLTVYAMDEYVRFDVIKADETLRLCTQGENKLAVPIWTELWMQGNYDRGYRDDNGLTGLYHAIGKKEVCECRIHACARRSNNDIMEFVEQYAIALSDPTGLAVIRYATNKTNGGASTLLVECSNCETWRSSTVTDGKKLEASLDSHRTRIRQRMRGSHIRSCKVCQPVQYSAWPSSTRLRSALHCEYFPSEKSVNLAFEESEDCERISNVYKASLEVGY